MSAHSESLTDAQPDVLYRIMDHLELLALINSGRLRVSRVSRFSDSNELVNYSLLAKSPLSLFGWTSKDSDLARELLEYQSSLFVSSWTRTRDSIAMWEIYSRNLLGVQIEVSQQYLCEIFKKSYQLDGRPVDDNERQETNLLPFGKGDCEYVNYERLVREYSDLFQEYEKKAQISIGNEDEFHKIYCEFLGRYEQFVSRTRFLKDAAYDHEREFRFILAGMTRSSESEIGSGPLSVFRHTRLTRADETDENFFVPFDPAQIRGIFLDGRLPSWKLSALRSLFPSHHEVVQTSQAYGSWLKRIE